MQDRRKFVRFFAPFKVEIKDPSIGHIISTVAENISMGGMKISVDKSINFSTQNPIEFFLLFPKVTCSVSGKIVWEKECDNKKEAGVSFINIPDTYKEDIYNYVFKYYPNEILKKWWNI